MSSVGLLLSSLEYSTSKTFIGVFKAGAVFSFEGCTQIRVLAGAVDIEGYLAVPSGEFHTLYSPVTNPRSIVSSFSANSKFTDSNVKEDVNRLLYKGPDKFVDRSFKGKQLEHHCIVLDLDYKDVKNLNEILGSKNWRNVDITAVILLRETSTTVLEALMSHHSTNFSFESTHNVSSSCQSRNLKIMKNLDSSLSIPESYRQIALDVDTVNNPIILVCGSKNSGKSTFCRILTNLLLNQYSTVALLECDVGQCEFTVSGIVALHTLTKPIFGPSFVHLRDPEVSYVFGDTSPNCHLDLYLHLIDLCIKHHHHINGVSNIPLIINTCGWTTGLGISLLLDLIKQISPTHIVQFINKNYKGNSLELPPLTPQFIKSNFGWSFITNQIPQPQQLVSDIGLFSSNNLDLLKKLRLHGTNTPILLSSGTDEGSSDSEKEDEEDNTYVFNGNKRVHGNTSSKCSKKGRYEIASNGDVVEKEWLTDLKCKLFLLSSFNSKKISRDSRKLSIVAYFAPLLDSLSSSLRSEVSFNFIMAAIPYEIPWSTVAIHSIHRKVPNSQLLYAINGNFVALSLVKEEEIIDYSDTCSDIKVIKSVQPDAEFIGLGLVRGINPDSKLLYITSPLSSCQLNKVNCLILGNWERSLELLSQHHILSPSPYILQHFKHHDCGRLGWNEK